MTVLVERTLLTSREAEVMALVCEGMQDAEIAEQLDLAYETIKSHMRRAMHVLGARNRTHAAVLFILERE